jgi:hypothetical protein
VEAAAQGGWAAVSDAGGMIQPATNGELFCFNGANTDQGRVVAVAPTRTGAGGFFLRRSLQLSAFQKTEVPGPVEDDVIQQVNAHDGARGLELGGDGDVAWRRFASWTSPVSTPCPRLSGIIVHPPRIHKHRRSLSLRFCRPCTNPRADHGGKPPTKMDIRSFPLVV